MIFYACDVSLFCHLSHSRKRFFSVFWSDKLKGIFPNHISFVMKAVLFQDSFIYFYDISINVND
jgi:hypothetical protein